MNAVVLPNVWTGCTRRLVNPIKKISGPPTDAITAYRLTDAIPNKFIILHKNSIGLRRTTPRLHINRSSVKLRIKRYNKDRNLKAYAKMIKLKD